MYSKVLAKIKPPQKEEACVREFVNELVRVAKTISGLDCVIVGSIGKQTWLHGDHDIDLFMEFPRETPREELEKKGMEFGKKIAHDFRGKIKIKYAEHPYTHAKIGGFSVDIVPCYKISRGEKIISAVDRSPLHLAYLLEKMDEKLYDEVRLLKQFCKGIGVYGSDARRMGFSGYICELLVLKYGSFEAALRSAAGWSAPVVISMDDAETKEKFHSQPLVIIDPVDENRNVAANLNAENFFKFMEKSGKFLQKQSEKFFFPAAAKALDAKQASLLAGRRTHFIALQMKKPNIIDDVLYPQLRKMLKRTEGMLRHEEFVALRGYEFADKDMFLVLEMEIWKLPEIKKMVGPPVFSRQHSSEFLAKYRKTAKIYVEDVCWVAEKKREFVTASALLNALKKKTEHELAESGIPKNLIKCFQKARIIEGKDFFSLLKKEKSLSAFVRERYF